MFLHSELKAVAVLVAQSWGMQLLPSMGASTVERPPPTEGQNPPSFVTNGDRVAIQTDLIVCVNVFTGQKNYLGLTYLLNH